MLITNLDYIPGKEIKEHYGVVSGSSVRSKHAGKDLFAGIKNFFGGELKTYTALLSESREQATQRAIQQAQSLGANALVNIRYSTSAIAQGAAEIFVYGTAVRTE